MKKRTVGKVVLVLFIAFLMCSMIGLSPMLPVYADTGYARDEHGNQIYINMSKNTYGGRVTWQCVGATVTFGAGSGGLSFSGLLYAYYRCKTVSSKVTYYVNGHLYSESSVRTYAAAQSYCSGSYTLPAGAKNIKVTCTATFKCFPPSVGLISLLVYWFCPQSTFTATSYYA